MSDVDQPRPRQAAREVAEQTLALYTHDIGAAQALAAAQSADRRTADQTAGGDDMVLERPQRPITLEGVGEPLARDVRVAEQRAAALSRARQLVAAYVPSDRSLVEELMAERRAAAAHE